MRNKLLLSCLLVLFMASFISAQSSGRGSKKFTSEDKKYNDWDVAVFVGMPIIQGADLTTFDNGDFNFGYDVQLVGTKQITHSFGLAAQLQIGETGQSREFLDLEGRTEYYALSILGDLNLSSLFRRSDNQSPYRWALHAYGGVGTMDYETFLTPLDDNGNAIGPESQTNDDDLSLLDSFFAQAGGGLRFKFNRRFDFEAKAMYVYTGDEEFDGSPTPVAGAPTNRIADYEEGRDDSFWTFSLGAHYKIGKHDTHLSWANPLDALYDRIAKSEAGMRALLDNMDLEVCKSGDEDDDGVCDDWDRELDTPAGARVDGAGRALDTDLDGIMDIEDACVTEPGIARPEDPARNGCPDIKKQEGTEVIDLSGVLFEYNKATWYPEYNAILDEALEVVRKNPDANFILEGHTDSRGSASYNQRLSQRRANAVKKYFTDKGVASNRITAIGRGEEDLLNNCTNGVECTDEQHRENRRLLFRSDRVLSLE